MESPDSPRPHVAGPPDPRPAGDAAELVALLGQLRMWSGRPSLRRLTRLATKEPCATTPLPDSTTSYVLSGRGLPRLPRLEFVEAYVAACLKACDLSAEEIGAQVGLWRETWRRLSLESVTQPALPPQTPPSETRPPHAPPLREEPDKPEKRRARIWPRTRPRALFLLAVVAVGGVAALLQRNEPHLPAPRPPGAAASGSDTSLRIPAVTDAYTDTRASRTRLYEGASLQVGSRHDGHTYRAYLRFDLPVTAGKQPRKAVLTLWNHESSSCGTSGAAIEVRRITSAWSGAKLRAAEPATSAVDAASSRSAFGGPHCDGGYVRFDVTEIVRAWASGAPNHGLQLRGADAPRLRKFYSTERGEEGGAPQLDVTYNTPPAAPAGTGDTTLTDAAGVRTATTPAFSMWALIADADGEWVDARFEISHDPAHGRSGVVWTGTGSSSSREAARITLDGRVLSPGGWYQWRVRGDDGAAAGPWSPYLPFRAAATASTPAQSRPNLPKSAAFPGQRPGDPDQWRENGRGGRPATD
ncbi:DNRLRE domain-containing protein [Nonomuraea angiospora]|uniref:DNRLRE domain-containing protein n=1 Tax=Nonomuraea angiospora TaxID=46172 RepID=UPI0034273CF0